MVSKKSLVLFAIVAIAAIVVQVAAINLVTVPDHDEYAYAYNSLLWSGRINNTTNIAWVERPPLFWWGITFVLSLGVSPLTILAVSPMFAVLLSLLIMQFATEITGDRRAGFAAGLFTAISGFIGAIGAHVLTDVMGTFFATLCVYSFYKLFIDKRNPKTPLASSFFCVLWGSSLALGLIVRDENLVLIPIFVLMWIFAVARVSVLRKLFYAAVFGAVFGGPMLLVGLINEMQLVSNILTPIVIYGWWAILLGAAGLAWYLHKNGFPFRRDLAASFFAFFALLLPFFFDNVLLANEHYIAGKGILSRPISHLMMLPVTHGVGASLSTIARAEAWISAIPNLMTPLIFVLAAIGLYRAYKTGKEVLIFLFLWLALSMGYVIMETNLEFRFLLIAFPALCICAAFGVSYLWRINRWVGVASLVAMLPLIDIFPGSPISLNNETVILGLTSGTKNWIYGFLATQSVSSPAVRLSLPNMIDGMLGLVVGVGMTVLIIGTSGFSTGRNIAFRSAMEKKLTVVASRLPPQITGADEIKTGADLVAKPQTPKRAEVVTAVQTQRQQPLIPRSPVVPTQSAKVLSEEQKKAVLQPRTITPSSQGIFKPPVSKHYEPIRKPEVVIKRPEQPPKREASKAPVREISTVDATPVLTPDSKFFQKSSSVNSSVLCQNCRVPVQGNTCRICGRSVQAR